MSFAKQPKGLYPLFFTELWERFGFYLVQTILILYMSKGLQYDDDRAYLLYGVFSSMLYLTPVIGGYLADRYMGFRKSIVLGIFLFILGYAVMAIPHPNALFLGLSIVIIANGFFKPNVSSIVGDLYPSKTDPRRDGGFTLFYMGINIGSLLPPIFAGALVAAYSWGSGFSLASFGMVIALITFLSKARSFGSIGEVPEKSPLRHGKKSRFYSLLMAGIVAAVVLLHFLFYYPRESNLILIAASLAITGSILFFLFREKPEQRRQLTACLILILLSIGFWAVYNQTFTSLMLFADRNMAKEFLGFTIDAEFTQFFNPFFIILFSPVLSRFWIWLDERNLNPSTPAKFSWGILFMALGFFILWGGNQLFSEGGISSPWWLVASYFLQTIGELLLSPIGMAMVTRLSPQHLVGMMMGVWFLTNAAAFAIGGTMATLSTVPKEASLIEALHIYDHAFLIYGIASFLLALLSFSLVPYLRKLIGIPSTPIQTPK